MDNATALQEFERSLRRRFPDRSTPVHYVSDVRQFQRLCPKPVGRGHARRAAG